ncbi:MAG TPA: alpha-amylase family glycosyl hydrolase, partial [Phycisphaerae bacterium]|nr:alpha-amylase family glycosyl hydrolase [Phycisphaerae bacterium]
MSVKRRPVPALPEAPRAQLLAPDIRRSYPSGKQEFCRAFAGKQLELTITAGGDFPPKTRATLITNMNAKNVGGTAGAGDWIEVPFERIDERTFMCRIVPQKTGLYSFWTRFSINGGMAMRDSVPDTWVLVDPPQVDQMRMYTLIPAVSGTIDDWTEALTGIKQMGFNAVHLLPLTTLDTSLSPYSARELFDVDPSYCAPGKGTGLEQIEAFVEKAKSLGIQLCFDLVLNHIGTDSNMARRATDWIVPDAASPDGMRRARYWCDKGWLPWNDLVLIDYEHPSQETRAEIFHYMTEYALFWAHYANQTNGFVRFDNLHSSHKAFVDAVTVALHREYPNVGVIAEYFTDAGTLLDTIPKWGLNLILATPWDSRFVPQLRGYLKYIHSNAGQVRFYMPITSHDSGSPAQEFGGVQSTIPRYVAAALLGTGATGITQGVEWGVPQKIDFIGKHSRIDSPKPPPFGEFLRQVNEILAAEP